MNVTRSTTVTNVQRSILCIVVKFRLSKTQTVCVTGATGYLASHVVQQLLERGYIVHGTVRSITNTEKHRHLLDLPHSDNLKLFEADLLKEGSFTDAIKGCSIVFHTASPYFISGITNAQEQLVEPALKGTLNVLTTCKEVGTVTKVVITSSTAAVSAADTIEAGVVHTEENWNTYSTIENGPYPFSKVQAERRAWKFIEDGAPFSLIVVNPPLIIGPPLQKYEDLNQLNTSNKRIAQIATTIKEGKELENWQYAGMGLSDVRDVAKAHILLAETDEQNQRFLCVPNTYKWKNVGDIMTQTRPQLFGGHTCTMKDENGKSMLFNSEKIHKAISIQFTPIETTLADTLDYLSKNSLI